VNNLVQTFLNADSCARTPEQSNDGSKMPGQIIIHDRNRVQNEMLPFYFNHASFASFRRNLSYFSFVRLGRGRHTGAVTYINDAVYELVDILHLKRRGVGCPPGGVAPAPSPVKPAVVQEVRGEENRSPMQQKPKQSKRSKARFQEPKDVASAVISGKMHACETNHDLETKKYPSNTAMTSNKSISAITLGTKSRGHSSSKLSDKKKRPSSKCKKYKIGGPRVHRLLYANGIVPFIHLPVRLFKARELQKGMLKTEGLSASSDSTKKARKAGSSSEGGRRSKKARFSGSSTNSSGNDEGTASVTSRKTSAVASALLALRSGP
jgi:hypothetical protein